MSGSAPGYSILATFSIILVSNSVCTGPGSIMDNLWGGGHMKELRKRAELFQADKGKSAIYRTLNFISCTAMLSQKPSMANFEAV